MTIGHALQDVSEPCKGLDVIELCGGDEGANGCPSNAAAVRAREQMVFAPERDGPDGALFAGSDGGAEHWATVASLIETCKLNDIDPLAYLTDVLTRIINGHPNRDIDQLLPWAYRKQDLKAVA